MSVVKGKEEDTGRTYYALVRHKQDVQWDLGHYLS